MTVTISSSEQLRAVPTRPNLRRCCARSARTIGGIDISGHAERRAADPRQYENDSSARPAHGYPGEMMAHQTKAGVPARGRCEARVVATLMTGNIAELLKTLARLFSRGGDTVTLPRTPATPRCRPAAEGNSNLQCAMMKHEPPLTTKRRCCFCVGAGELPWQASCRLLAHRGTPVVAFG